MTAKITGQRTRTCVYYLDCNFVRCTFVIFNFYLFNLSFVVCMTNTTGDDIDVVLLNRRTRCVLSTPKQGGDVDAKSSEPTSSRNLELASRTFSEASLVDVGRLSCPGPSHKASSTFP